jgi:hypothetical protein
LNRLENTILSNLFFREEYARKALPFLKAEYFSKRIEQVLFGEIVQFVEKYNNLPTKETILIEVEKRKDINEEELTEIKDYVAGISNEKSDEQWLFRYN